ncbi:hypothetical protein FEV09_02890 [Pseudanabaena catenata USMAC16]|uniref:Uncharacterized protein n=2 Tax=Pseudanabaena TaxID=1152 RepID=L8N245_9CYAN|nr:MULTISPECIES: hypothetical protein [Pseudanabaena]ELS34272.1 hypothetical protein Pse7429DRAFT_0564 [Pseudanabaena biceps PCC 7429]MDG3493495.1 hypothetical protein [Pseudanabaena catenata USMAC16]
MSFDNTCKFLAETFPSDFASWLLGSAIADIVRWVKDRNPTMRNDNLIVELLLYISLTK